MKKFRWILLSGLLVASTHIAQAQAPGASPAAPGFAPSGGPGLCWRLRSWRWRLCRRRGPVASPTCPVLRPPRPRPPLASRPMAARPSCPPKMPPSVRLLRAFLTLAASRSSPFWPVSRLPVPPWPCAAKSPLRRLRRFVRRFKRRLPSVATGVFCARPALPMSAPSAPPQRPPSSQRPSSSHRVLRWMLNLASSAVWRWRRGRSLRPFTRATIKANWKKSGRPRTLGLRRKRRRPPKSLRPRPSKTKKSPDDPTVGGATSVSTSGKNKAKWAADQAEHCRYRLEKLMRCRAGTRRLCGAAPATIPTRRCPVRATASWPDTAIFTALTFTKLTKSCRARPSCWKAARANLPTQLGASSPRPIPTFRSWHSPNPANPRF